MRCDNLGIRGLRQSGFSAVCDEGFRALDDLGIRGLRRGGFCTLRQEASAGCDKTSKSLGKAWRQPSVSSAKYLFRHNPLFPPLSSTFAIIVFRHHCVPPSSSSFVKFTWNLKGHSRHLQGISRVQVEPNCVHLGPNLELTT